MKHNIHSLPPTFVIITFLAYRASSVSALSVLIYIMKSQHSSRIYCLLWTADILKLSGHHQPCTSASGTTTKGTR